MPRRALSVLTLVAAAVAAALPAPSAARNLSPVPAGLDEQAASPNFTVHYTSGAGDPHAIAPEAAQRLLVVAERALGDSRSRLALPRPLDDGDGRADVYVFAMSRGRERGMVIADSRDDQTSGWIALPPNAVADVEAVTHEIVHLQQLALYRPAGRVLAEASATWAPLHLYAGELPELPDRAQFFPGDPLDCDDALRCARPGHGAWPFLELLAERHGSELVRALYDRSRELGNADHRPHFVEALEDVLGERGTTLTATFADFTAANLVGDYALRALAGRRYGATEPVVDIATGARSRRFRARAVRLDHLSAAFVRLRSGVDDAARGERCERGTLRVRVEGPRDLEAPVYWARFRPRRGRARPLPLVAGRARLELPWSTCGGREIGIGLHNPAVTVDGRRFVVRVELRRR